MLCFFLGALSLSVTALLIYHALSDFVNRFLRFFTQKNDFFRKPFSDPGGGSPKAEKAAAHAAAAKAGADILHTLFHRLAPRVISSIIPVIISPFR